MALLSTVQVTFLFHIIFMMDNTAASANLTSAGSFRCFLAKTNLAFLLLLVVNPLHSHL